MLFLRLSSMLCLFAANIRASSHWMVTETGLIQSKEDSPFVMTRPFDLLSFMNQETRWHNLFNIYDDLLIRQKIINSMWAELEEQSDIPSHITENEYCKVVGELESIDWYTSIVEDGKRIGIMEGYYLPTVIEDVGNTEVPDCKKISSLTFSMSTFEHLEALINRENLNASAEMTQPESFSPILTVNQYGHWIAEMLHKNTTSWLHYNLASIYWRIKGNMPKAMECSRRAVHYAPRRYKAIPLLCMGSILHRCEKTDDAITVLSASVDHSPGFTLSHLAIGEAYAVAGDFNNSIKHLNASITLNKGFTTAIKYKNAVLCHIELYTKMQFAQRTVNKLLVELDEFLDIERQWFKIHAALLKSMKHDSDTSFKMIEENCIKVEKITHLKIRDLNMDRDRNSMIHYLVANPRYTKEWKGVNALNIAYELHRAVKLTVQKSGPPNKNLMGYHSQIERKPMEILKEIGPTPLFPDNSPEAINFPVDIDSGIDVEEIKPSINQPEMTLTEQKGSNMMKITGGRVLYPSDMKVNRNAQDFDVDSDWPSNEFCQEAKKTFPASIDPVYPVYMPFENKGINLQTLLTSKIGVSEFDEHELPWHPPLCPIDKDLSLYTSKKGIKVTSVSAKVAKEYLWYVLLSYVSTEDVKLLKNMQDAEIGQRIHTAMQRKLAPKWALYTLASLYWRVRGNSAHALSCLLAAQRATDKYLDVPLVSLASVLLDLGLWEDALSFAEEAYKLNPYEPPTNFLLAQIHMVRKNQKAQFFHLKQTLRVDPEYMTGRARSLLNCWSCIAKQVNLLKELGGIEGDKHICVEIEPGMSTVCDRDGSNCRVSHSHCSGSSKETSTLLHMLKDKDDVKEEVKDKVKGDIVQVHVFINKHLEVTFNRVLNAKPLDRKDKTGHKRNYDLMITAVREEIRLCKNKDCAMTLEQLDMKKEDCSFNKFEFDYWLHYISFQQEFSGLEEQISVDIASLTPSRKKVPECVVPAAAEGDFFLPRVLAADSLGWGASLALMQHFADLFNEHDYGLLGAKLAKYVDLYNGSWWAALAAGWWCGSVGRGACAVRCLAAAHALAPATSARRVLRPLVAFLHLQNKHKDAMDIGYLAFYASPKSEEAFLLGISHFNNHEIDEAVWMYRYALAFEGTYVPATICLHMALCQLAADKDATKKQHQMPSYAQ